MNLRHGNDGALSCRCHAIKIATRRAPGVPRVFDSIRTIGSFRDICRSSRTREERDIEAHVEPGQPAYARRIAETIGSASIPDKSSAPAHFHESFVALPATVIVRSKTAVRVQPLGTRSMSRTRRKGVWRRCAAGVALGHALGVAGCLPNEDLSTYRSMGAEAALPASSTVPIGTGTAIAALPPGPSGVSDGSARPLDAGGAPALDGQAALHHDGDEPAPAPATPARPDAGPPAPRLPGALVGASRQTLDVAGAPRSFLYYAPAALDPNVPAPLLIVAHGFEETAADMLAITGFDAIADREGFVVLYPEGQGTIPWNIGSGVCQGGARPVAGASGDDSAFIDAMLAFVALDRSIDGEHVFMSGLGSGGYLANDIGCRRSDIRAVVSHSGGSHALDSCVAAQKPVLLLHGSDDTAVPVACSSEARERWAEHNGCSTEVDALEVLGGSCEVSRDCPENGQVTACTFEGMGRGWAGGSGQAASFLEFASASELSWQFFTQFAW
jgi:polyhydroxybutyrate depolymerase